MRLGLMYLKGKDYNDDRIIAPLAFGYLASYLEHYLDFHDTILEVDNRDALLSQSPDIIGFSSFTETFEDVIHHARAIKQMEKKTPIIIGGEHISAIPESLPPEVDIGVLGEGEQTLLELVDLYQRGEATPDNLYKVKGIVYWHQGRQVFTEPRPWIEDMDSIPMPNRHLLLKNTKWQQPIFTARGCPYKCTFCASTRFWQRTRYHSVGRVIQEIEYIVEHFPEQKLIPINDDLFPLNRKRLKAIVDEIRSRKLHDKVGFVLNARASVFDEEIARLVVGMNCQVICFGLESASDKILTALKGKTSAQDNQRALEICERFNLPVVSNMMLGTPEETPEDVAKSYWFMRKNQHRFQRPSIAYSTPFPGTGFWDEAKAQGVIDDKFERWNVLDLGYIKGQSLYMNKHMDEEEFEPIFNAVCDDFQTAFNQSSWKDISATRLKRRYFEGAYEKLLQLHPPQGRILEIGYEDLYLADLQPELDVTKLYLDEKGELDLSPIAGESFDTLVLSHALEKWRHPQEHLDSLRAHLSPQAELLCLYYDARHPHLLEQLLHGRWMAGPFGAHHYRGLRFYTQQSLRKLLNRTGWAEIQVQTLMEGAHEPSSQYNEALQALQTEFATPGNQAPVSLLLSAQLQSTHDDRPESQIQQVLSV